MVKAFHAEEMESRLDIITQMFDCIEYRHGDEVDRSVPNRYADQLVFIYEPEATVAAVNTHRTEIAGAESEAVGGKAEASARLINPELLQAGPDPRKTPVTGTTITACRSANSRAWPA